MTPAFCRQAALEIGKTRRLNRIFSPTSGRTLIAALDDGLIFGPFNGLENLTYVSTEIQSGPVNAVLAFPGTFKLRANDFQNVGWIVNLTASTDGPSHTRKAVVGSVEQAASLSADAVAVHVNYTDEHENEMLKALGDIVQASERFDMPVLAIMYPRRCKGGLTDDYDQLKSSKPAEYLRMVAHAVRIGAELGADIVKTKYTGDSDSFQRVIESAPGVPIVIAGGELTDSATALANAAGAITAGAAGTCYGRNIYQRSNLKPFIKKLGKAVHG